jgi:dTDP-4-dehydrorhamnose 3,5-epimerase
MDAALRRTTEGVRDGLTARPGSAAVETVPDGVRFRRVNTIVDERGSLCEMFDERWEWPDDPLVYSYFSTLRPGVVKGWALHREHEDRYFVVYGEMEVTLYDDREDSPTRGLLSQIYLTELDRRLMNIPAGVWHADRNVGHKDVLLVNFPTRPFDHDNPDKFRLPIDTELIPHSFGDARGW